MTQEEKRIRAERLLAEMSYVDDRFIFEAETAYEKKRSKGFKTLIMGAVSLSLALAVAVGAFAVAMMNNGKGDAEDDGGIDVGTTVDTTLSARLSSVREQTADAAVKGTEIDLFDGSFRIIWRYADEEEYRAETISYAEYSRLVSLMTADKGERVPHSRTESLTLLWITSGDGRVISPCLEQTAGNVGYGELFDYVPEYEPSAKLTESICDCIS